MSVERPSLTLDARLHHICFSVGFQGFATVFMAHIIMGKDKLETLQALEDFARVYAQGLKLPKSGQDLSLLS